MRNTFQILIALLFLVFSCDPAEEVIIKNVSIFRSGDSKPELVNILIENGVVQTITKDAIDGPNSFDLKGRLITPPFWDMHAHLHDTFGVEINDFKKYGVHGIRDMGIFKNDKTDSLNWYKNQLKQIDGFSIYPAGYIHNGSKCEVETHQTVDNKEDLINAISVIRAVDFKFFKIHNCFPSSLLSNLVELCQENDIKIVGHIPEGIDPLEFSQYQVSSIEHIDSFLRGLFSRNKNPVKSFREAIEILDGAYLDSLAINMKSNNISMTPTLVTYENFVKSFPESQQESGMAILKKLQSYTKRLWDNGVTILAGTDYPLGGLEAGKSYIRELELLVESGIPVHEVLKIAFQNPLDYLGLQKSLIEEGAPVNFIVIEANENIIESLKYPRVEFLNGEEESLIDFLEEM